MRNPLASDYLRNHSDAAKDPKSRASLKDLHGDVILLGYDRFWKMPTGLSDFQVSELAKTLKRMDRTISIDRIPEP